MSKFSPGSNCCEVETPSCERLFDDFNRADSSSLGANWTEVEGDWSIASNRLSVSTADALVEWTGLIGNTNGFLAEGIVRGPAGAKARIYWEYNFDGPDASTYSASFWEIKFGPDGYQRLGFGNPSILDDEDIPSQYTRKPTPADADVAFVLCVDQLATSCIIDGDTLSIVAIVPGGAGLSLRNVALGTGPDVGGGSVVFDNVRLTDAQYHVVAPCPTCRETIVLRCLGVIDYTVPDSWDVTLAGFTGDATPLNAPWSVPLYGTIEENNITACEWFVKTSVTLCGDPVGIYIFPSQLVTSSVPYRMNFWLMLYAGSGDDEDPLNYNRIVAASFTYYKGYNASQPIELEMNITTPLLCEDVEGTPTLGAEPVLPATGIDFLGCTNVPETPTATITASSCGGGISGAAVPLAYDAGNNRFTGSLELADCWLDILLDGDGATGELGIFVLDTDHNNTDFSFSGVLAGGDATCDPFVVTKSVTLTKSNDSTCCGTGATATATIVITE